MKRSSFFVLAPLLVGAGYLLATLVHKANKPIRENEQEEQGPNSQPNAPFDKDAGEPIDAGIAKGYTKAFRVKYWKNTTFANYCSRIAIEEILKNPECAGLRIYRAIKAVDNDKHGIIIVGVTKQGVDITKTQNLVQQFALAQSYDKCESNCDNNSVLRKN